MNEGDSIKLNGFKMTVVSVSEQVVRLEAHGWKCWFPRKALVPYFSSYELASWFTVDEYCTRFFDNVERKEFLRKSAEKTFHIEIDDDGETLVGWKADGEWFDGSMARGTNDSEGLARLLELSLRANAIGGREDQEIVKKAFLELTA